MKPLSSPLISFDLDDTLICYQPTTPREPNRVPRLLRPWFKEPVRAGTTNLMRTLVAEGWRIAIYTTSHRSRGAIRGLLRYYGVRPALLVNQVEHERALARQGCPRGPTKWPSLFGIRLHVDDSEGVLLEGRQFGFEVVVVRPDDLQWADVVLDAARAVSRRAGSTAV
ncbi:MAG: hypothetical protein U0992_09280 [Planctomycetaceae bacterium]